ncbi:MAG: hypothetical protein JST40_08845 [Armatimonadetes bacterium]|nr:hypothetical protein [Armatimonadota bacterium]
MSDTINEYDPDRPEGGSPGSSYLSRRDFRVILLGLALIFIAMIPVYLKLREDARSYDCMENIKAAGQAIATYAADNDEHMPPAFEHQGDKPRLHQGLPVTWATIVYSGMNSRKALFCPTATEAEISYSAGTKGLARIPLSFGFYLPMEFRATADLKDPDSTILLAETVNGTVDGSFNPKPMEGGNDGYVLGYDTGNDLSRDTVGQANSVTRLAFFQTENGKFGTKSTSRHGKGIHVVYVSGRAGLLRPVGAKLQRDFSGDIDRPWILPPRSMLNQSR